MSAPVLDELSHRYQIDGQPREAVTRIIKAVWPTPPTHDRALPHVLENARVRGIRVDYWTGEYASKNGLIEVEDRPDVCEAMDFFHEWWTRHQPQYLGHQVMVWDQCACGTLDLKLILEGKRTIVDVKRTYDPQETWAAQVGGYADLAQDEIERTAILQIHPRFIAGKKYGGIRCEQDGILWHEWPVTKTREWWRNIYGFWKTVKELAK